MFIVQDHPRVVLFPLWGSFLTGTVLITLDLTPSCHSTKLLPELMPITFLLYLTLYFCGTRLILGMLMLNLCVNLKASFSGAV